MPILPHNQRAIDSLKPQTGERTIYRSEVVTGLVLEVMPSGKKTWRVRYRTPGGRQGKTRAFTIGDAGVIKLGPALDKAREVLSAIQIEGRDPHAEKAAPSGSSFEALFGDWLERHAKVKKKSWKHDEEMYRRHVHERLGRLAAADIKRADVAAALDDITKAASGIQANRAQTLIGAVFNWAVNEGRLEHSPTFRIPKRGVEVPRERILTETEIKAFWHGLAGGPLGMRMERVLRLALVTGQRRSKIAEAPKVELDLTAADPSWTIAGARAKNSVMHRVPLTPLAVELFCAAVADSRTAFVFPGRGADDRAIDPHAVTRAMTRLMRDLGVPVQERWLFPGRRKGLHLTTRQLNRLFHEAADAAGITKAVNLHALRHSFATHLYDRGVDIRMIQALLGRTTYRPRTAG